MAANNIKIITVGVGSTAGAPIPVKAGSNTSDFKKMAMAILFSQK